jgi:hypothetical protein
MVRPDHRLYDLHELLSSVRVMLLMLTVASFFVLFVSFQFIYVFALIFGTMFAIRGLIGRRCPKCDGALKETGAERDKANAFVMHITWRCPRDGYEEKEQTKGDAGLFGVK